MGESEIIDGVISILIDFGEAETVLAVLGDRARQNAQIMRGDMALIGLMNIDLTRAAALAEEQRSIGLLRAQIERELEKKRETPYAR